jgi:hypothetical protein
MKNEQMNSLGCDERTALTENDQARAVDTLDARKARGRPKSVEVANRLHIAIPESLTKRLMEIQKDTHAGSITEVVKNALTLYAAAIEEHKSGGHVYFKRANEGVERQLALFI